MERQWEIDVYRHGRWITSDAAHTKADAFREAKNMLDEEFQQNPKTMTVLAKISLMEFDETDRRTVIESHEMILKVDVSLKTRRIQ